MTETANLQKEKKRGGGTLIRLRSLYLYVVRTRKGDRALGRSKQISREKPVRKGRRLIFGLPQPRQAFRARGEDLLKKRRLRKEKPKARGSSGEVPTLGTPRTDLAIATLLFKEGGTIAQTPEQPKEIRK